jgi:flagellar basal body rod protein FlgC
MTSLSNIALSGMGAALTQANTAAHNVANLGTEGFTRQEVVQTAQPGGGVSAEVTRAPHAGNDLATDMVAQLQAKNAFLANLAVFKTGNAMAGALLDIKA